MKGSTSVLDERKTSLQQGMETSRSSVLQVDMERVDVAVKRRRFRIAFHQPRRLILPLPLSYLRQRANSCATDSVF